MWTPDRSKAFQLPRMPRSSPDRQAPYGLPASFVQVSRRQGALPKRCQTLVSTTVQRRLARYRARRLWLAQANSRNP